MESTRPNIFSGYNLHAYGSYITVDDLLRKLHSDACNDWFYQDANTLVVNLDIIFTNIMLLARGASPGVVNSTNLLKKFLMLLVHIFEMWQTFPHNRDKLDMTRLCELLWSIVNGPNLKKFSTYINRIVREILEFFLVYHDSTLPLRLFRECLLKGIENELLEDVCYLLIIAVRLGLFKDEAMFAKDWILKNLGKFIKTCFSITPLALQCLHELYKSVDFRTNISEKLFPYTVSILVLCCHDKYKQHTRTILTEMISDFVVFNNTPWKKEYPALACLVQALPEELKFWPISGNDIFFVISLMVKKSTTNMQWQTEQITHAIAERVKRSEIINPPVLKAMCYFFPKSLAHRKERWFIEASCRLIDRLECSGALCEIIMPSVHQLAWILSSTASDSTKFFVLEIWLREDCIDTLGEALERFGLEDILLDYMQKVPANPLSKRAAIVASKIKSTTLPKKITVTLMQNLSYMDLFSNLLLSKPALPTEENQILTLCTVLGANLPYVQDKDAFVTLCSLSRRLLSSVKNEPRAMLQFCLGDGRNIKVIVGAAVSSDDVVGYNALNLLEKLMHLQIKNDVKLEKTVETNLARFVRGTDLRKELALKLIKLVLSHRNKKPLYLNYPDDISLGIYQRLHDFCGTNLADLSYACMLKMLRGDPDYFMFSVVTYALMDMQWNYPQSCAKSKAFLKFAKCWLQLVQNCGFFELPPGMKECLVGNGEEK